MSISQNSLLDKAIEIAVVAHQGQLDKAGKPYIEHPLRVMNNLTTVEEKIVGVLHDTIEDSELTLKDLRSFGFKSDLITALEAITKVEGEDYELYLQRVMSNPLALKVKIADMTDNMDMTRLVSPTERDHQRLQKYQSVLPKLEEALKKFFP